MPKPRPRSIPGVIFAILVILLALGNLFVGIYPYGQAVWIRPLFGLTGVIGAIFLLIDNGWWRILLPVWCLLQSWTIATDVSGEWFYQGIRLGASVSTSHSIRINEMLTEYDVSGFSTTGIVLLAIVLIIAIFQLHPPIRRKMAVRPVLRVTGVVTLVILAMVGVRRWGLRSATFVLDTDLPRVPIYYKDQCLGVTPLAITPEKVRQWGLPLANPDRLKLYSWGWADCEVLSDGVTHLPLYAGAPWPFASYLDTFDSPWGLRCRMHIGREDGQYHSGYLYPKAERRSEPVLQIQLLSPAVQAGGPLTLRCTLTNPTTKTFTGRSAQISRHCFPFGRRDPSPATIPAHLRREAPLPANWNTLAPGQTSSADLIFDAPLTPDQYELFCTWELMSGKSDNSMSGGCYSNMLMLNVGPESSSPATMRAVNETR